jgi:hypothetical protein
VTWPGISRSACVLLPALLAFACGQSQRDPATAAGGPSADGGAAGHGGAGGTVACRSVEFDDPKVDAAVRSALGVAPASGPLSAADVAPLRRLQVTGAAALGGFECLSGLTDLALYSPAGVSLVPLAQLPLKTFAAYDGSVTSPEALTSITTLEWVILEAVGVTDLSFAAGLNRLASLFVTRSTLSSLVPISALPGLESLVIENTKVADLTPLAGLSALSALNISNTQVSEVDAIPAASARVELACLYAENVPLSAHAISKGIPALCARGWSVRWSTGGSEHGTCNASCDK